MARDSARIDVEVHGRGWDEVLAFRDEMRSRADAERAAAEASPVGCAVSVGTAPGLRAWVPLLRSNAGFVLSDRAFIAGDAEGPVACPVACLSAVAVAEPDLSGLESDVDWFTDEDPQRPGVNLFGDRLPVPEPGPEPGSSSPVGGLGVPSVAPSRRDRLVEAFIVVLLVACCVGAMWAVVGLGRP